MAEVLQDADIVICTVAAVAKVTLAENFHPTIVYVDEASRLTEFKTLIALSLYAPLAFILTGDHKQLRPTVLSAERHRDQPPFLNPFQNQMLLSFFERMIVAGHKHFMLKIQHRCTGNISGWVSKQFYHNQVERAPLTSEKQHLLTTICLFVHQQLRVPRPTNRYAVDLTGSRSEKENGGTSSYNKYKIQHVMNDIRRIRAHPALQHMTIGILSFYKAQITRFRAECFKLPGITIVDGNEHLSHTTAKTVDGAQGAEFDIVIISFVRTNRPTFIREPYRMVVALTRAKWLQGIYTSWSLVEDRRNMGKDKYLVSLFNDLRTSYYVATRAAREVICLKCQETGHMARDCT
jgi:superfamily I DNA and/or RNA helicase